MKSPKVKGIGEVVTDYGAKVMKVIKKGLLGRSLFDFYGDVKTNALRVKESPSVPQTPIDQDGGVVYVKTADGKLYYKSNEVAEVELSAHTGLSTEEVQDIAGALVTTGGTKTGIAVTYQDATGDVDFVVDHDAATNFVAEEHYRWDNDIQSTATINHLNLSSDTPAETEVLVMNNGDAVWGHGEKIHIQIRNDEGATIPAGAPLYSRGEIGGSNRIKVGICDADDSAKMPCIGIAEAEMNTSSTKDNFAITQGVYNTNISGFTGLSENDILYVDTSGSAPHLTKTKPTGESSLIQNVGVVLKTNGSTCQGLQVSAIGRTNDVPNLNSGYVFYGNGSNQAVSTQLSTLLPPDLTVDGAGTVHANNYTNTTYSIQDGELSQNNFTNADHTKLNNIEDNATADQTQADINGLAITTVGTIGTGVWQGTTIKTAYIGDDQITEDKLADTLLAEIDANTAKVTNVSTNLTYTTGSDRITIVSSDGTNVVIAEASGSIAGVMTVAHHDKLDGIEDSATADQTKSDIDGLGITTVGALSSGTIASGFGNIDNGTSTLDTGLATVSDLHVSIAGQASLDLIDTGGQTYKIFVRNSDDVFGLYDATNTQTFFRYTGHATPASTKLALLEAGGKVGIGTTSPSKTLDVSGDITCTGNILPGITTIKILPRDFIADDGGRPLAIDDTGSDRWLESHSTNPMFASVEIPPGFKATHVDIYGNGTSAVTVYEANINDRAVTSKGTGNIGTQINITDVTSNATNYLLIELVQTSVEQVNGGIVTITKA